MSSEEFIACCKLHGFSLAEIDQLNFGFLIDTVISKNSLTSGKAAEENVSEADQSDIDAFFM